MSAGKRTRTRPNRAGTAPAEFTVVSDPIGERIVHAAAESIMELGFGGATTETIARAARTSKRSIYQLFPDKQALFEGVMAYLCSLPADAAPDFTPTGNLRDDLVQHAMAVLDRFVEPQTRAVFVAAVGASRQFPEALDIFWASGPGQAAKAIAASLSAAKRRGDIAVAQPQKVARQFLMDCCGPAVLGQLFDPNPRLVRKDREAHVNQVVDSLFLKLRP